MKNAEMPVRAGDVLRRVRNDSAVGLQEVPSLPVRHPVERATRILVVAEQPLYRAALRTLIDTNRQLTVTAECSTDAAAVERVLSAGIDVAVVDFDLVSVYGEHLARFEDLLRLLSPRPVLVVTCGLEAGPCQAALRHGISGIVLKEHDGAVLLEAIDHARRGQVWLDRPLLAQMFGETTHSSRRSCAEQRKVDQLTPREREIVEVACTGLTNKQIAARLSISEATVRHHLGSVFAKLGVSTRSELVVYGYRHNLCRPVA